MFKPWVFPRSFLRAGVGNDRDAGFPAMQLAYVRDLDRFATWRCFPAARPRGLLCSVGRASKARLRRPVRAARLEPLRRSMRAFTREVEIDSRRLPLAGRPLVQHRTRWSRSRLWKTNFLFQAGAAFRKDTSPIFEFRVAFGVYQPPAGSGESRRTRRLRTEV